MKSKWFRRMLAGALSAAMCCGLMAGCGEQDYEPTDALYVNTPSAAFIMQYWSAYQTDFGQTSLTAEGEASERYAFGREEPSMFSEEDTPEITQRLQAYYDDLQMDIMKAQASDIISIDDYYWNYEVEPLDYMKLMKSGAFVDLYEGIEQTGFDLSGWNADVLHSLEVDGRLNCIPNSGRMLCFTTTKQLMDTYEFPYDPDDTALEFLRKCAQWKEQNPDGPEVFDAIYWTLLYRYWYELTGDPMIDFTEEKVNFDQETAKELLELIKSLKPADYHPYELHNADYCFNEVRMQAYRTKSCLFSEYWTTDNMTLDNGDYLLLMPIRHEDGGTMAYMWNDYLFAVPSTTANAYHAVNYVGYYLNNKRKENLGETVDANNIYFESKYDLSNIEVACDSNQVNDSYCEVVLDAYNQLEQYLIPQSWMYTMRSYFDDYYADKISVDELTRVLQEKMEIYITE